MTERQSEQGTRPSEARPRNKDQEIIPRDYQETIPRDSTKRQYQKTISGDKTKEETRPIDKIKWQNQIRDKTQRQFQETKRPRDRTTTETGPNLDWDKTKRHDQETRPRDKTNRQAKI
jgi:hypothetical protein